MAANLGRNIDFRWGGDSPADSIQGIREKGIQYAGEPIDISDGDSAGWRELFTQAGQNAVTISLSGVTKDRRFVKDWFAGDRTQAAYIGFPWGDSLSGNFYIASLQETGAYNDAITFQAEIQSTGAVTYTPAP